MKKFNKIFPTEIISDILIRLPTESVFDCKLVCKTWKNLIQHPSFPKIHSNHHLNHPDSADSGKLLRYVISHPDDGYDFHKHVCYFEYDDEDDEDWSPILRQMRIDTPFDGYIVIGSFNGLVCIYGTQPDLNVINGPALIFNPVTREYLLLPEFDRFPEYETKGLESIEYFHLACGFGYLAETNEYKVVRIYGSEDGEPNFVEVEVFTVGSGKGWRHVGKFGFGFRFYTHLQQTNGVFLNGCLHWRSCEGGMVVVFDLAGEKFRDHIPPPPVRMYTEDEDDDGLVVIGVCGGGFLYYVVGQAYGEGDLDDVWLLMKKNNDGHAMKELVDYRSWGWSQVASLDQREPFTFTGGGSVLRYGQGNVKMFISSTSNWENFGKFDEISRQVYPHKHTLVSLKELGEEDAEIMKPRI